METDMATRRRLCALQALESLPITNSFFITFESKDGGWCGTITVKPGDSHFDDIATAIKNELTTRTSQPQE